MSADAGQIDAALILREARYVAARLVRTGRIRPSDGDDAAAELIVTCLRRANGYDPRRAALRTFVSIAARSAALSLLRHQEAKKRRPRTFPPATAAVADPANIAIDVVDTVARLPQALRELCDSLARHSFSETARRLCVSRTRLRTLLGETRAAFIAAGWEGAA